MTSSERLQQIRQRFEYRYTSTTVFEPCMGPSILDDVGWLLEQLDACQARVQQAEARVAALQAERDKAVELLRKTPHDMGCHPSEGLHTARCMAVREFLGAERDQKETP